MPAGKLQRLAQSMLLLATSANAQLVFDRTTEHVVTVPDEEFATACFPFTNSGGQPATIARTNTSCGCTVARLDQRTIQPGEDGVIEAKLRIAGRRGEHRKTVRVFTDDGKEHELTIVADIFQAIELQPAHLRWQIGAPIEAQSSYLVVNGQKDVRIKSVDHDSAVEVELVTHAEGRLYELTVRPQRPLESGGRATIRLLTDCEDPVLRTVSLTAAVYDPEAPRTTTRPRRSSPTGGRRAPPPIRQLLSRGRRG